MFPKRSAVLRKLYKHDKELARDAFGTYQGVMRTFLEDYPLEIRNKVLGLLRARDFVTLLEWVGALEKVSLADKLESVASKRAISQLVALIKKYPFPAVGLAKSARAAAWKKFQQSEQRCWRYNLKFQRDRLLPRWEPHSDVFKQMSDYIRYVLGDEPDMESIYEECSFGPGASIGVHGDTNLGRKLLSDQWTCTPSALSISMRAMAKDQHIWELIIPKRANLTCLDFDDFRKEFLKRVKIVQHNKIVFVPKTTMVDRTIAVEPLLNGYVQKGIDVFMRRCLKRVGIDLSDQDRNQRGAYMGSYQVDDPFVTIDLSSASDSISIEVVRRFLPPAWFDLLNQFRSKFYELDGVVLPYNKFTSMGNGFCFPLETLLFASVCSVFSKPGGFAVYGDDIIVRQSVANKVLLTLRRIGFRHNPDKTFLEGNFRESCGADWVEGQDVRPLALDYALDSVHNIIKFHNMSLRKPFWSIRFQQVREYLFGLIPEDLRLCRPYQGNVYGAFEVEQDIYLNSPFTRWNKKTFSWEWMEIDLSGAEDKISHPIVEQFSTVLMMAALRGSSSQKPFSRRRQTTRTVRLISYAGASSNWLPVLQS